MYTVDHEMYSGSFQLTPSSFAPSGTYAEFYDEGEYFYARVDYLTADGAPLIRVDGEFRYAEASYSSFHRLVNSSQIDLDTVVVL
jgi:dihydropteroate synthase